MKTSTVTSFGAMALVTATTTAAVVGNLRLRRSLSATRAQLGEARTSASHDLLTGLANRRGIEAALAARVCSGQPWALALVDLDGFKPVNDTHGHAAGDLVLAEAARRLRSVIDPATDVVGRLGGDEFVVLAASPISVFAAMLARDVVAVLREPFTIADGVRVDVSGSVGVAQAMAGDDPGVVLRCADTAMYRAKAAGGDAFVEYGPVAAVSGVSTDVPALRLRDAHPHQVPAELGVVIAR